VSVNDNIAPPEEGSSMMPHLSQPGYDPQIQVKLLEVLRMPIGPRMPFVFPKCGEF